MVKEKTANESSLVVSFEINEIVGASFTGVTVKAKVLVPAAIPSVAEIVIFTTPFAFATGVIEAVQFG